MNANKNDSITIVTAFFEIGRSQWNQSFKRTSEDYLSRFKTLATLDNEMIIFTSEDFIDEVSRLRNNKPTKIIKIDFNKKFKHTIQRIQNILDSADYQKLIPQTIIVSPEYNSAEYVLVNNLKYYFVNKAISLEPNKKDDDLFAWVDFGFCRKPSTINGIKNWYHDFDPNHIHLFTLKDPFILEDKNTMLQKALHNEVFVIGSMIVGSKNSWRKLYPLISNLQTEYLNKNISDDDQGTMLMTLCEYPDLFTVHKIKKGWFSGFKQFNKGSTYKNIFYKIKSLLKI